MKIISFYYRSSPKTQSVISDNMVNLSLPFNDFGKNENGLLETTIVSADDDRDDEPTSRICETCIIS